MKSPFEARSGVATGYLLEIPPDLDVGIQSIFFSLRRLMAVRCPSNCPRFSSNPNLSQPVLFAFNPA